MDCHESLMQRRRKKKANAAAKRGPGVKLDKSLPSLPPSMEETRSIDEPEPYVETADTSRTRPDASADRSESSASRQAAAAGEANRPVEVKGLEH